MINYWKIVQTHEEEKINSIRLIEYKYALYDHGHEYFEVWKFHDLLKHTPSQKSTSECINQAWIELKQNYLETLDYAKEIWFIIRKAIFHVYLTHDKKPLRIMHLHLISNQELLYLHRRYTSPQQKLMIGVSGRKDHVENLLGYSLEYEEYIEILKALKIHFFKISKDRQIEEINDLWSRMIPIFRKHKRHIPSIYKHMRYVLFRDLAKENTEIQSWYPFNTKGIEEWKK